MASGKYFLFRKKDDAGKEIGPYWARKRRKGIPDIYLNCETSHKASASKRADAWVEELIAAKFGEIGKHTFADAAAKTAERHFPSLKYKSKMRYEGVFNRGIDIFGNMDLSEIDSVVLGDYEHIRREQNTKPNTIGLELRILSIVFKHAKRLKWFKGENPCLAYLDEYATSDIKARIKREYYLTHQMEADILAVATNLWRYRIIFGIESGLRLEEQFSLLRKHVDLKTNRIQVMADVAKNREGRYVPLTPRAKEAFVRTTQMIPSSDFAFPREDGERIAWNSANIWRRLQQLARAAWCPEWPQGKKLPPEFNLGPHWLRKTCGCRLLQDRRFPIEKVSKWLGHKSIAVTQASYAFLYIDHLEEMVAETQDRVQRIGVTKKGTTASVLLEKSRQISDI